MDYGKYEFDIYGYTSIPANKVNGGWYSGIPFYDNAAWGTIRTIPDQRELAVTAQIGSEWPENPGLLHMQGERPGNNPPGSVAEAKYPGVLVNTVPPAKQTGPVQPFDPNRDKYN